MSILPAAASPRPPRSGLANRLVITFVVTFVAGAAAMVTAAVLLVRLALTRDYTRADARAVYESRGIPLPDKDALATATQALSLSPDELISASQALARHEAMERLLWPSILLLVAIALITGLVAWWLARRRLSRLVRLGHEARLITEHDLGRRLDAGPPTDEVTDLADSVDALLDRLERSFDAQKLFASQASHELRTPLAALRTEAETLLTKPATSADARELAGQAVVTVERSERLIRALLALARADSGRLEHRDLDFAELAGDIAGELATTADRAGLRFDLRLESWSIRGDPVLLRSLITNLLENAIRYSPQGGRVTLGIREGHLSVENDGPVLSTRDLERIQLPFERLESGTASPAGTGIGLTVVGTIARAHDLQVGIQPRAEGGLLVTVTTAVGHPGRPARGAGEGPISAS